jgi:hypothetical protein
VLDIRFKEKIMLTIQECYKNLEPMLNMFSDLRVNYCNSCIKTKHNNLVFNVDDYGYYDTGKCDSCGQVGEVVNPFIITVLVKSDNWNAYDIWNSQVKRIYTSKYND